MNTFENLNLSGQLMKAIKRLGFKEPMQIQRDTIPLILEGKDVIGESATGSGKTLAFGAGIIEKCHPRGGVQAIVLVPTRELAEQVKDEMTKISYGKAIRILAVYGGVSINPQIAHLRKSEIVIATPGRLLDHLNRRTINTSQVKILVLDEADRMVEMGFIHDVERIIKACPRNRQTLLFSATMYGSTKEIAKRYMKDPTIIHATKMVDPTKLKQSYYHVPPDLKKELLVHLLHKEKSDLVMVFCNTRRATDMVVRVLKAHDIKSAPIHGGLNQSKRLSTIDRFHNGNFQVLVCTDVAARGLHIEGVTHIYNFDIPKEPGDYVHRIGRTARAGKSGMVINIVAPRDQGNFSRLMTAHRDFHIQKEERPHLKKTIVDAKTQGFRGFQRGGRSRGPDDFKKRRSPRKGRSSSGSFRDSGDRRGTLEGGSSDYQKRSYGRSGGASGSRGRDSNRGRFSSSSNRRGSRRDTGEGNSSGRFSGSQGRRGSRRRNTREDNLGRFSGSHTSKGRGKKGNRLIKPFSQNIRSKRKSKRRYR